MFTGKITEIGRITGVHDDRAVIRADACATRLRPGGSLNVAGVRVTAERVDGALVTAAVSPETRRRTTFDRDLEPGRAVNLETPLTAGAPVDGHLVQGHVDAVGKVTAVDDLGTARRVWIRPPARFLDRAAAKGSIGVDGVSLTIAEIVKDRFSVALVPATLAGTTLAALRAGDRVNLESDVLARLAGAHPRTDVVRAVAALGWAGHATGRTGVEKAVAQLAAGGAVLVWDGDREVEGDVIFGGAALRPEAFTFLLTQVYGYPCVPCAPDVLDRLEIPELPGDGDRHGTAFHAPVDLAAGTGTGVSAAERAATVRHLARPDARPGDFHGPGHVIPIASRPGLLAERRGHTEATVALCTAAGLPPVGVCCEVMNPDGTMAGAADLENAALRWGLPLVDINDLHAWL
ncbi:riboflavin synthase [Actinomadura parmotrematis]|uniref:3,4-dihydroxy-2-butanone-4-phosphate synthase n=1 Tax=Actinomadura parmotrematis TaxID=2864039 RepID=A0ABS7G2C7_9ACTN|nr:riboflavin synthase [Actinomadura parmotrematis]MBW8486691.1 riboflavin synthase [Actinomadura parmotrematis]